MKQKRAKLPEIEVLRPRCVLVIEIGDYRFYAHLEDNPAAEQFVKSLHSEPLTVRLSDDRSARKSGTLPFDLPSCDAQISVKPGDLLLDGANRIAICNAEGAGNLTRLARVGSRTEELFAALGDNPTEVRFYLEWSE